jgi:hypothetical protein
MNAATNFELRGDSVAHSLDLDLFTEMLEEALGSLTAESLTRLIEAQIARAAGSEQPAHTDRPEVESAAEPVA